MSGHSKWATTKHKKAVVDARRGKMFAKLIKNIEVAAKMGGGDPAGNPTLYDAIQKAKKSSVPNDNIDRAVKRGSGAEAGGASYDTIMYEVYGPQGVAFLVECLTDNRNRAALEAALDAGVEEVNDLDESFEVVSEATDVVAVRSALQDAAIDYDSAEVQFVASMDVPVDADAAGKIFRLVDALEDLDDVQNVFTNVDVPDEVMATLDA